MSAGRVTSKTKIFEIKIELREVRPAVLRRVQVPGEMTLAGLHQVVQVAMGWTDSHLHEFEVDGARYGLPDPDWNDGEVVDEARVKLFRLVGRGDRMDYVYDFGDGWTHRLTVEKVLAAEPGVSYPWCVSGRRACPPEDVGGPWGYEEFVAAMADPAHAEHEHYRQWIGDPFDPAAFDLTEVNAALAELAWRPLAAPAGSSGSARGRR
jgi:Plasmid pRiA4b ORF-3-like protein